MNFRRSSDDDLQINLTPLIDVVFLLLIFFMVTTTFTKESQLRIELPEASTQQKLTAEEKLLTVDIGPKGEIMVKGPEDTSGKELVNRDPGTIMAAMRSASEGLGDLTVVIRADRLTPHESVVQIMDTARRLGLVQITFSTRQEVAGEASRRAPPTQ